MSSRQSMQVKQLRGDLFAPKGVYVQRTRDRRPVSAASRYDVDARDTINCFFFFVNFKSRSVK